MSEPTFATHLTQRQIRIVCEGLALVLRNPASAPEAATAERLVRYFEQAVTTAVGPVNGEHITMTGHQLKRALELTWPDGDADPVQGYTVASITRWPVGSASDESGKVVETAAGLWIEFEAMPEEGMQHLPEVVDPRTDATLDRTR